MAMNSNYSKHEKNSFFRHTQSHLLHKIRFEFKIVSYLGICMVNGDIQHARVLIIFTQYPYYNLSITYTYHTPENVEYYLNFLILSLADRALLFTEAVYHSLIDKFN